MAQNNLYLQFAYQIRYNTGDKYVGITFKCIMIVVILIHNNIIHTSYNIHNILIYYVLCFTNSLIFLCNVLLFTKEQIHSYLYTVFTLKD